MVLIIHHAFKRRNMSKNGKGFLKSLAEITGKLSGFIILLVIAAYFATGIHQINSSEVGLVIQFGKAVRTEQPGINYHLPRPFENVIKIDVKSLRSIDIGFRKKGDAADSDSLYAEGDLVSRNAYINSYRKVGRTASEIQKESLMMTSDNNFAKVQASIQYKITDPMEYAFKITFIEDVLRCIGESFIREKVAEKSIDEVLTTLRNEISFEAAEKIQQLVNSLQLGIKIVSVKLLEVKPPDAVTAAFDDVNSAIQDKEKKMNLAIQYYNDIVPKAQGEASKTIQEAQAYSQIQILNAEGEADRFLSLLGNYEKAPDITKKRMYLDSVGKILQNSQKVVFPSSKELNGIEVLELLKDVVKQ
jgi:membrane protease subunit HflK